MFQGAPLGTDGQRVNRVPGVSTPRPWRIALIAGLIQLLVTGWAVAGSVTLAWDPSPSPGVSEYRVYVGVFPGQYFAWYDVPARQTWFVVRELEESATYYFAVASKAGSVIGPQSEEVFGIPSPDGDFTDPIFSTEAHSPRVATPACQSGSQACPVATLLGIASGDVGPMQALPGGRVLVVEDGRRVRLVRAGWVDDEPAGQVSQATARIAALAVDPRFPATHTVLVGETRTTERGRTLDVLRYRELNGILGEPAAFVVGVPVPGTGDPQIAMDERGDLFIALPGPTPAVAGSVLRFAADGSVPKDNPTPFPAIGAGPALPKTLSAGSGALWVVDEAGHVQSLSVGAVSQGGAHEAAGTDVSGTRVVTPSIDGAVVSAAIGARVASGEPVLMYLVSDAGTLWQGTVGEDHLVRLESSGADGEHVMAVAAGADGVLYLATRSASASDGAGPYRILRLADK